jgi:tetratricopeptide (TPR) repeat protein
MTNLNHNIIRLACPVLILATYLLASPFDFLKSGETTARQTENESAANVDFEHHLAAGRLRDALLAAQQLHGEFEQQHGSGSWPTQSVAPAIIELEKVLSMPPEKQIQYRTALFLKETIRTKVSRPDETALTTFDQVLEKIAAIVGKNSYSYVQILHAQSGYAIVLEHFDIAEKQARECLRLANQLYGNHHPYNAHPLNNLGLALLHQGRLAEAEVLLKQSYRLLAKSEGTASPAFRNSVKNLGLLYLKKGEPELASSIAGFGLSLAEKASPTGRCEDAGLFWNYAQANMEMECYEEALQPLKICEHKWSRSLSADSTVLQNVIALRKRAESAVDVKDKAADVPTKSATR